MSVPGVGSPGRKPARDAARDAVTGAIVGSGGGPHGPLPSIKFAIPGPHSPYNEKQPWGWDPHRPEGATEESCAPPYIILKISPGGWDPWGLFKAW